jgi:hypothetical protein
MTGRALHIKNKPQYGILDHTVMSPGADDIRDRLIATYGNRMIEHNYKPTPGDPETGEATYHTHGVTVSPRTPLSFRIAHGPTSIVHFVPPDGERVKTSQIIGSK